MTRVCYNCKRELTLQEAADGQLALDEVVESFPEFEGWVHCKGPPTEFVQEDDKELEECLASLGGCNFFPDSIHICRPCIVAQWKRERGIEDGGNYNKDVKEFQEFIRDLNVGRK